MRIANPRTQADLLDVVYALLVPALPPVPNVLRVQLKHTVAEDFDVLTRLYFQYTGSAPSNTGLNTMAAAVVAAWGTDLKSWCYAATELTEVTIVDLTTSSAAVGTDAATTTGTRAGHPMAAGSCLLVNFHVARRYRGGKPRVYLPFMVAEDLFDEQEWVPATIASFLTAWNTFIAAVIAAAPGGTTISGQVNVSYYEGFASVQNPVTHRWKNINTPRAVPLIDAVVSTSVNNRPGSQRRRNLH